MRLSSWFSFAYIPPAPWLQVTTLTVYNPMTSPFLLLLHRHFSTSNLINVHRNHTLQTYLVDDFNPSEKYDTISWDDSTPNIWKHVPNNLPVTTKQSLDSGYGFPIVSLWFPYGFPIQIMQRHYFPPAFSAVIQASSGVGRGHRPNRQRPCCGLGTETTTINGDSSG